MGEFLVLKLQGPMQAWGEHSFVSDRRRGRLRRRRQVGLLFRDRAAGGQIERDFSIGSDHQTREQAWPDYISPMRPDRKKVQSLFVKLLREDQGSPRRW